MYLILYKVVHACTYKGKSPGKNYTMETLGLLLWNEVKDYLRERFKH